MITKEQITSITEATLTDTDLYIVDVVISPASDIELIIDSDSRVNIDQCAHLSRTINAELEALGEDDFSLTVASSGVGNPLKISRQYTRCVGSEVEILLANGTKRLATLEQYNGDSITVTYDEKVTVEGKKRKEIVRKEEIIAISELKSVCEALTIK